MKTVSSDLCPQTSDLWLHAAGRAGGCDYWHFRELCDGDGCGPRKGGPGRAWDEAGASGHVRDPYAPGPATFRTAGIDAVPAATDYEEIDCRKWSEDRSILMEYLPDAEALARSTKAVKEYIGFVFYRWRGWIASEGQGVYPFRLKAVLGKSLFSHRIPRGHGGRVQGSGIRSQRTNERG